MRVFVAGATGAIGGPLVRDLVSQDHTVFALTRSGDRAAELAGTGAEPVVCDVFDRERLVDAVRRSRPEAIINELTDLPARLNPRRLKRIYTRNDALRREGTANLLAAARECGALRLVVQSAAYWYAPGGAAVKTEADPLYADAPDPIGEAVRTMREVEQSVLLDPAISGVVLRYGQFYGPGTWYAREGDIGRRVRKRIYPMIGDGSASISFIHVGDAARATVAALRCKPGVYNVVDDDPAPATEWMPEYARALGAKPPMRVPVGVAKLAAGRPLVTWSTSTRGASNAKAKSELDWKPVHASWRTGFCEALG